MTKRLALHGGTPVRAQLLPYGRQSICEEDIEALVAVLRSDYLTTGPAVETFERAFAEAVGARHAIAVSSGTAALHATMAALGLGPGDEVIVPAITFAATANAALFVGARPVFCDVDPDTLLLDPCAAEARITERTRAVVAVDYAGQPCDYDALARLCGKHGLHLVADACHSLGGTYDARPVGSLAELSAFSFHPVKMITTGEGGMVSTDSAEWASHVRRFRSHCMSRDYRDRDRAGTWSYDITELGYNYRLSDLQCALGTSQLRRLPGLIARRREIARQYDEAFSELRAVAPLKRTRSTGHAYHLYVVTIDPDRVRADRQTILKALKAEGIGVNVHYPPLHLLSLYQRRLGTRRGDCPRAESLCERIMSLPLFPDMTEADFTSVIAAVDKVFSHFGR